MSKKDVTDEVRKDVLTGEEPANATAGFTGYFEECRKMLDTPEAVQYFANYGISRKTAASCEMGFVPKRTDCTPGMPRAGIIVPVDGNYYISNPIPAGEPIQYRGARDMGPGFSGTGVFNRDILYADDVETVFVADDIINALSLMEAGARAIAPCGMESAAAGAGVLISMLCARPTDALLVLCMGNDPAGRMLQESLRASLDGIGADYEIADACGSFGSPNEYLRTDREGFMSDMAGIILRNSARPDDVGPYFSGQFQREIDAYRSDVGTGYRNLDAECGGLFPGLYVIAAMSSLGKTTFAHQMADQIAMMENHVIYFSLELSRLEMESKSIARATAAKGPGCGMTSLTIRQGGNPELVADCARRYSEAVEGRMNLVEGGTDCTVPYICKYVKRYMRRNKARPVVFIDYLQLLPPDEDAVKRKISTKETVDLAVTALRRMTRELGITVIVISSINRAGYLSPISFESLKESGGIEFGADVVWGMQLSCMGGALFQKPNAVMEKNRKINEEKARNPRSIDLICLKDRFRAVNYVCGFDYYAANETFMVRDPGNCII